jgi:hypothetical protein
MHFAVESALNNYCKFTKIIASSFFEVNMSKEKPKERFLIYNIIVNEDTNIVFNENENGLELRNSEGELSEKNLVSVCHAYRREGKAPKILRQAKYLKGVVDFQPKNILSDRYLAIDASYEAFGENFLCATSCHLLTDDVPKNGAYVDGDTVNILQMPRLVFLAKRNTKPERYGWKRYMEALINNEIYSSEMAYCAIVDSDLDEIPRINSREMPILPNDHSFYLPEGIEIQYASADSGIENMQNRLIRLSDKVAKKSLSRAKDEFKQFEFFSFDSCFFDLIAYSDPTDIDMRKI